MDLATDRAVDAARRADELWEWMGGKHRTLVDWAIVALTWLALVTNVWLLFFEPHGQWHDPLMYADAAIAALIFVSICVRWLRFRIGWVYLGKHLWEIPALFPFIVPVVGEWHWVMWLVLIARFVRMVDRTDNVFGDKITKALVQHFADPIVDTIKRPITIAVLDEVITVIRSGDYATNVRKALDENHDELETMVLDLIRRDETAGKLRYLPFHDDIVTLVADVVLRVVNGALDDPRTTELISDVIRNSADQLRHAIRSESSART